MPAAQRGSAFGWYHMTTGGLGLAASVLFGAVWDQWGSSAAFVMGAAFAAAAGLALALTGLGRNLAAGC